MKKIFLIFIALLTVCPEWAYGAMAIKKAAPVAKKETSAMDSTGSLVPTVIGLVGSVQALNAKSKELTEECIPTSAEITWVNNMIKEWAKTGAMTADQTEKSLGTKPCKSGPTGGYARSVEYNASEKDELICHDWYGGSANEQMIWKEFPIAAVATYCTDGSPECGKSKQKTVSNIYSVFNLIDFTDKDYTKQELSMATKLMAKMEKCSDAKVSAAKREMYGNFLMETIGNAGQKTNTGTIMESVSNISSQGLGGGLGSLGGLASQFLNK